MFANGTDTPDAIRFAAEGSNNVDQDGNFSVQVLSRALKQKFGLQLQLAPQEVTQSLATIYDAFVCNFQSHWFAIRKLFGVWLNCDSTLKKPKVMTETYLSSFLYQLKLDKYSIFIVTNGNLPSSEFAEVSMSDPNWHTFQSILDDQPKQKQKSNPISIVPSKQV
eukprot:c7979_g1_i3.p1 GENE.c7979_g1_i3~~c7979_g1_i3.p1  ORF type:complete len:165 (-),score=48.27 c7979_g1_i3:418-912(-)